MQERSICDMRCSQRYDVSGTMIMQTVSLWCSTTQASVFLKPVHSYARICMKVKRCGRAGYRCFRGVTWCFPHVPPALISFLRYEATVNVAAGCVRGPGVRQEDARVHRRCYYRSVRSVC